VKQLEVKQITKSVSDRVYCPHCDGPQGDFSEYSAGEVYECENCWRHYTVPLEALESARRDKEGDPILKELKSLERRIKRLEKELGVRS
jgi:hypothetical protein